MLRQVKDPIKQQHLRALIQQKTPLIDTDSLLELSTMHIAILCGDTDIVNLLEAQVDSQCEAGNWLVSINELKRIFMPALLSGFPGTLFPTSGVESRSNPEGHFRLQT